jgi:acetyl-CoA C-acetyltransferase
MKAAMLAHDALLARSNEVIVAGGMESMTNAPYLLPRARAGLRMGHGQVIDHVFCDGLEDAYEKGRLMGTFAEDTAVKYGFSRHDQDAFAIASVTRAQEASQQGLFAWEMTPMALKAGNVALDEPPFRANPAKIPTLKPAFRTAAR